MGLLLAFSGKLVDFAKYLRVKDTNAWVTQVATWVAGITTVWLASAADLADVLALAGVNAADSVLVLEDMSGFGKVFLGASISSLGSFFYDFKKAFDNTQTSATPSLVTGETNVVVEVEPPAA